MNEIIKKLPWYNDYLMIQGSLTTIEKELDVLKKPEKHFNEIKTFYQEIGADYTKNEYLKNEDNREPSGRIAELEYTLKISNAIINAVEQQDDKSISALISFGNDGQYGNLMKQIKFYIGISKIKEEPALITDAYDAIVEKYPLNEIDLFRKEGAYYYLYYFQCVRFCVQNCYSHSFHQDVKNCCCNARQMFRHYLSDESLKRYSEILLSEISAIEKNLII